MQDGAPTRPLDYMSKPPGIGQGGNWLAVFALVCGIASLIIFCYFPVSLPLAAAAIVSAVVAEKRVRRLGLEGRGLATAGLRCGLVAVLFNLGIITFLIYGYSTQVRSVATPPVTITPQGFQSPTYYSKPEIPPEVAASVDLAGVYFQGKLEGLRVDRVTPDSHLGRDYGLWVGDEIIQAVGVSFDGGEPLNVAKARALADTPSNLNLTVIRDGKAFYISPGVPPHELPAGQGRHPFQVIDSPGNGKRSITGSVSTLCFPKSSSVTRVESEPFTTH